ncbi:TPA: hypothetical protein QDA82_000708 [Burkholderia vietnamiensis]|nr:hypothetical protein [Burkholderia vietnamiensis]
MSTRRATAISDLSGFVARKDRFKREGVEARTALRRVGTAYRITVSASAASLAVTVGIALALLVPAPVGCRPLPLAMLCVVEAVLAAASIATSFLLHRQADRIARRLARSTKGLARARARLLELRSTTPEVV